MQSRGLVETVVALGRGGMGGGGGGGGLVLQLWAHCSQFPPTSDTSDSDAGTVKLNL